MDDASPQDDLVPLAYRLTERLTAHYFARIAEFGLSRSEAKALITLQPGEALLIGKVAELLWADRSNTTHLINRLAGRGLVERRAGSAAGLTDGRARAIVLTSQGEKLRRDLLERTAEANPVYGDLSPRELHQLRELLSRLDQHARAQ
ncbi:MarR family winged helix-turn-helix transcriptional regulator [Streptomyces sp. NPDC059256]|uniref:MarR family winged helix-turn-helix transcriptional regulator n=1 Tax=Streptomyces sp. NPDC059256 TaxID=3346794 RepID=UPI0036783C30